MRSNSTAFWEQVKNNTWQETAQAVFVAVNCLVLLVALHVGIVANLFVAWAVYRQKSLQTSNNALLVNLAVIDIFRCSIDCPLLLSIIVSSSDAHDLGLLFCSVQIASFSLICCVQLLTLACISAERFQAIANPFKSAERRKRIMVWIPLTWLVPISISAICVIFAKDSPVYVRCRGLQMETLDSYDTFGFYILIPVWFVCLTIIIGFYGRIFLLVKAHERKIFDKGSLPPPDKKKEDKKQKKKEINAIFKSDNKNPQMEANGKASCGDLKPVSEELPKTTVSDSLNSNMAKKLDKDKLNNEEPLIFKGIMEPSDHQNTSTESSPTFNEDVSVVEKTSFQISNEDISEESLGDVEPNDYQKVAPESLQSSEKLKNHQDTTSPSNFESNAPEDRTSFPNVREDPEESAEEQLKSHQNTSPSTNNENGTFERNILTSETSPKLRTIKERLENHQDITVPSTEQKKKDGTFETNNLQDITSETSRTSHDGRGEEHSKAQQDTTSEMCLMSETGEDGAKAPPGASDPQQKQEEEEMAGAVCMMPSLAQRERGNAKKESKLAKRSGYIIFTFLVFWIPLITTVILNHFYSRNGHLIMEVFRELEFLTVSLVCLTSITNPIIYAAVNPQFRTEFYNLKTKWKTFFMRS
uniref:Parietopsin n=1 Tax=Danio rerio TaxID=7955 RepID=A0A0R4ICV1_DANRE|nr:uncharacterized protein LOC796632 isoform X1 [Danio rerio]|eukprot:XP_017209595.1 uncharacterized protein LOC796632 isoform X1 [Danio rerio]